VSLLTINNGDVRIRSIKKDTHLGGEDFDLILLDHFINKFIKKTRINIRDNRKALRKLRGAVEKVKIELSENLQTELYIENLINGEDI
jgi:molecular chaperone DnaK (HSP70)